MSAIAAGLGVAADTIGVISSITDVLFPKPPDSNVNTFRVHIGNLAPHPHVNPDVVGLAGPSPGLAAFHMGGVFLGYDKPKDYIGTGGHKDYSIAGKGGQPAHYLSVVTDSDDGICIYAVTGKAADSSMTLTWFGDLGKDCGGPWYPQSESVAHQDTDSYFPACVWLDSNGDNGHVYRGFNLHIPSFVEENGEDAGELTKLGAMWNKNASTMCDSEPRFTFYKDIKIGHKVRVFGDDPTQSKGDIYSEDYANRCLNIDNWLWSDYPGVEVILPASDRGPNPPRPVCESEEKCLPLEPSFCDWEHKNDKWNSNCIGVNSKDRKAGRMDFNTAIQHRQKKFANQLVVSHIGQHSASQLCGSATSLGPDFVSVPEGMFCDMSEKHLWPICIVKESTDCFDMETQMLRGGKAASNIVDIGGMTFKNYTLVHTWGYA